MVVETRSKLGGRQEQEEGNGNNEEISADGKYDIRIKEKEKKLGTEIIGVTIKQELIEENLNKKPTDVQLLQTKSDEEESE